MGKGGGITSMAFTQGHILLSQLGHFHVPCFGYWSTSQPKGINWQGIFPVIKKKMLMFLIC
jgi:hypothetical protein